MTFGLFFYSFFRKKESCFENNERAFPSQRTVLSSVTFFIAKKVTKNSSPSKNSLILSIIFLVVGRACSLTGFSKQFPYDDFWL